MYQRPIAWTLRTKNGHMLLPMILPPQSLVNLLAMMSLSVPKRLLRLKKLLLLKTLPGLLETLPILQNLPMTMTSLSASMPPSQNLQTRFQIMTCLQLMAAQWLPIFLLKRFLQKESKERSGRK